MKRNPTFRMEKVGFQPSFSSHIIYFQRGSGEQSSELAMPKLMQASLWSFGLTKTLSWLSSLYPSWLFFSTDTTLCTADAVGIR